eukprot:1161606-Pelagomonas_calceolata.AAC.16
MECSSVQYSKWTCSQMVGLLWMSPQRKHTLVSCPVYSVSDQSAYSTAGSRSRGSLQHRGVPL